MHFNQYVGLFCGFWATLFNLLLIPIIIVFSSEKIGNYKYCLLMYSFFSLMHSCCYLNTLVVRIRVKYIRNIYKKRGSLGYRKELKQKTAITIKSYLQVWYAPNNGFLLYSTLTVYPYWLQKIFFLGLPVGFCGNLAALSWCFMTRLSILQG